MIATLLVLAGGCAQPGDGRSHARRSQERSSQQVTAPPSANERTAATPSALDPCAENLHELCGTLLMYYATHRRLPETLDDLRTAAALTPTVSLECPESRQTYVYDPDGFPRPNGPGRIVLYDAEPSHSGHRWTIAIEPVQRNDPLIPRVVAVPESAFTRRK